MEGVYNRGSLIMEGTYNRGRLKIKELTTVGVL